MSKKKKKGLPRFTAATIKKLKTYLVPVTIIQDGYIEVQALSKKAALGVAGSKYMVTDGRAFQYQDSNVDFANGGDLTTVELIKDDK